MNLGFEAPRPPALDDATALSNWPSVDRSQPSMIASSRGPRRAVALSSVASASARAPRCSWIRASSKYCSGFAEPAIDGFCSSIPRFVSGAASTGFQVPRRSLLRLKRRHGTDGRCFIGSGSGNTATPYRPDTARRAMATVDATILLDDITASLEIKQHALEQVPTPSERRGRKERRFVRERE